MVISVGDVVTESLLRVGFEPDVKIIDFRSRRQEIKDDHGLLADYRRYFNPRKSAFYQRQSLINNPGTINIDTALKINSAIKSFILKGKKSWIVVEGEEDLLALPAVLFAPLHSVVLYGQMDLGVIVVEVTEEKKREVEEIVKKFI